MFVILYYYMDSAAIISGLGEMSTVEPYYFLSKAEAIDYIENILISEFSKDLIEDGETELVSYVERDPEEDEELYCTITIEGKGQYFFTVYIKSLELFSKS